MKIECSWCILPRVIGNQSVTTGTMMTLTETWSLCVAHALQGYKSMGIINFPTWLCLLQSVLHFSNSVTLYNNFLLFMDRWLDHQFADLHTQILLCKTFFPAEHYNILYPCLIYKDVLHGFSFYNWLIFFSSGICYRDCLHNLCNRKWVSMNL